MDAHYEQFIATTHRLFLVLSAVFDGRNARVPKYRSIAHALATITNTEVCKCPNISVICVECLTSLLEDSKIDLAVGIVMTFCRLSLL